VSSDEEIRGRAQAVVDAAERAFMREYSMWWGEELVQEGVQSWLGYIPPLFDWFTQRDGERLDLMMGYVEDVKTSINNPVRTNLDLVTIEIADWQGTAADNFVNTFLGPFDGVRLNQVDLAAEVLAGLQAEKEILTRVRNDAVTVANTTIEALDALEFDHGTDWGMVFTVIGAVAVVAGAAATGGGLGFALVEAGAGIASAAASQGEGPAGNHTVDVLVAMDSAVASLRTAMSEEEQILADALTRDVNLVNEIRETHLLPVRPTIAKDPAGSLDEFGLPAAIAPVVHRPGG
jgi:hypothetical protein